MSKKIRGDCYENAGTYVLDNMGEDAKSPRANTMLLAHGKVFSEHFGRYIRHAWVMLNDQFVHDPTIGFFGRIEEFQRLSRAKDVDLYTPLEMARLMGRTGVWGPWTIKERNKYSKS